MKQVLDVTRGQLDRSQNLKPGATYRSSAYVDPHTHPTRMNDLTSTTATTSPLHQFRTYSDFDGYQLYLIDKTVIELEYVTLQKASLVTRKPQEPPRLQSKL